MSTVDRTRSQPGPPSSAQRSLRSLYLVRGVLAVVWAAAFIAASGHLSVVAVALLVLYPAIDVVSSVYDASRNRSTAPATMQWVNAAISTAALAGVAVASAHDNGWVLRVFGAWATISGVIQLVVTFRRRGRFGVQWAMLVSGGLSTIAGIAFIAMAGAEHPQLADLAGYALLGGVFFLVDSVLLRRHHS